MLIRDEDPPAPTARTDLPGQATTLTALFDRYAQEIYRLCLGMLGDPSEAEDATQEVFLRAHRSWSSYDAARAAPRTWLGQITINYCRSALRARQMHQTMRGLIAAFARPEQAMGQPELRADLSQAISRLDYTHRSVVLLRYYMDLSCGEIAQALQISEGTVHSRLYYARRQIQAALGEDTP